MSKSNSGFFRKLRRALAYYPLTFYFGLLVLAGTIVMLFLNAVYHVSLDVRSLSDWVLSHQTILLLSATTLLGITLVGSAVTYRKVSRLSREEYLLWLQQRSTRTLFPVFTPLHDWLRLRIVFYRWWHTQVYASAIHYVLLLVFGLFVIVQLSHAELGKQTLVLPAAPPNPACPAGPPGTGMLLTGKAYAAGAVNSFTVTGFPSPQTAGTAGSVTVTAYDCDGLLMTTYTGTIHFASSDGQAVLPSDYTFVSGDNGAHTFTNGVTLKTAGTQSIDVNDTVTTSVVGSQAGITVNPTTTSSFTVSGITSPNTAGSTQSPTVTAKDAYSNTVTTYTGTIHFTSSDGQAVLPSNYTFVGGDNGVHTFSSGVTLKTAGTQSVTATDITTSATGSQSGITVNPSSATSLTVSGITTPTTAGVQRSVTVTAKDTYNNTASGYTGTIHFTSSDGQAVLPSNYTFVGGDNGVHTFTNGVTLKTAGSQSVTATDTVTGSITGNQSSITVNASTVSSFTVTGIISPVTAGSARSATVTAKDAYSNTVTTYTGTIHFTSSDGQAVLPSNYTFVGGDSGVHTFTNGLTLKTAGSQTVSVTDVNASGVGGTSSTITVNAGSVSGYAVTNMPSSVTAGAAFSTTVTAKDAYSNTVTTYTGTIHFTSSDGQAVLPSNYTFVSGDNGTHTLTNGLTLKTAGSKTIVVAEASGVIPSTTTSITVVPAAATQLLISNMASTVVAGSTLSATVTLKDAYNNTATNYTGTIHFTSSDTQAVLPSDYHFVSGDAGVHSFSGAITLKTAGPKTVGISDTTNSSVTALASVTVSPGSATQMSLSNGVSSKTVIAGTSITATVTLLDAYNNIATGFVGSVEFTSTDTTASLPAAYNFTANDAGVRNYQNGIVLKKAGLQTVTATTSAAMVEQGASGILGYKSNSVLVSGVHYSRDSRLAQFSIPGGISSPAIPVNLTLTASFGVTIVPGATTSIVLSADTTSVRTGEKVTLSVTAKDGYDNVVTDYAGMMRFKTADQKAQLPADYTFTTNDNGIKSFGKTALFGTVGSQKITVTDLKNSTLTSSVDFRVSAGPIAKYIITTTTPQLLNVGWKEKVSAVDSFENAVSSDSTTTITPSATNTAISFYSDSQYSQIATEYKLTTGETTLFVMATSAGKTTLSVTDPNGRIGQSEEITIGDSEEAPPTIPPTNNGGNVQALAESPALERTVAIAAAASTAAALASTAPAGSLLATVVTTNMVQGVSLFNLSFLGLNRRRRRKRGGIVRSFWTGMPVAGVFVELCDQSGNIIRKVMTDKTGEYAFLVDKPGIYSVQIKNPLYELYSSKAIEITNVESQLIDQEIILHPEDQAIESRLKRISWLLRLLELLNFLSWPLLIIGTALSILALYHNPTALRYTLVVVYAVLWASKLVDTGRGRMYGVVKDSMNSKTLANVVVQLTSTAPNGQQSIRSTMTDSRGRFLFVAGKAKYRLVAAKEGYLPIEKEISGEKVDLDLVLEPESVIR